MADYAPKYEPGEDITGTASATILGGQLLVVTGTNRAVAPSGGASAAFVGVAAFDAANGDKVTIRCGGVQRIVASGAITAGDMVTSTTTGRVVTSGAPAAGTQVGIALTTVADGALAEILMVR